MAVIRFPFDPESLTRGVDRLLDESQVTDERIRREVHAAARQFVGLLHRDPQEEAKPLAFPASIDDRTMSVIAAEAQKILSENDRFWIERAGLLLNEAIRAEVRSAVLEQQAKEMCGQPDSDPLE